ncbi:MAG: tetratricopeptide repeat protein, partial [Myxococcota bacterium]
MALLRGRLTDAVDHNRAAIGLLDDPADRSLLGDAWSNLGNAENLLGRRDEAIDHLKRALALQEEVGNAVNAAKTLGILGNVHQAAGNVARGVRFWREALGRHEAAGHRPGVLRMLGNLAVADHALGALDDASAGFGACAGLARELGEPLIEGIAHLNAGAVALEAGDDVRAEALLARARLVLGRTGARMYLARVAVWEAAISLHGRSLDLASRQLAHA